METNTVATFGRDMADKLGNALVDGLESASTQLESATLIDSAQTALASILLMFVGIAALYYVGRWLYKAFKRGAA